MRNDDDRRKEIEGENGCVGKTWKIDIMWMAKYLLNRKSLTPLWAGWNSLICQNPDYIQKVSYLPQINQSPTNYSVVAETMKRYLKVSEEAGKSTIAVTYDLAIAKIAFQIQGE